MLYFISLIIMIFLTICSAKSRLSLWIDENQVAIFLANYPLKFREVYIISDGKVPKYLMDADFNNRIPVIPFTVETVNLTWGAGDDTYTYWFDELESLNKDLLYNPLLSIPSHGVVPKGPKVFQMSIPCTGKEEGIAALVLGLQIFNKHLVAIRGLPVRLKLKKHCKALLTSSKCDYECQNGGRCNSLGDCECTQGFNGKRCELSMCDPGCENNGTCMSPEVCICPDGFSGKRCERALCSEPCQNGARCIDKDVCLCTSGYLGKWCQFNKCKPACKRGGVCIEDKKKVIKCRCAIGYTGTLCEKRSERPRRSNKNKPNKGKGAIRKRKKKQKKQRRYLLSELMRFTKRKRRRDRRRKARERRRSERRRKRRKLRKMFVR